MKSIQSIVAEWRKKTESYDKDGGFIVYVEGEDNRDFDVELMERFIRKELEARIASCTQDLKTRDDEWKNEVKKLLEQDMEAVGWEIFFKEKGGKCCPGDDYGMVYEKAITDVLSLHHHEEKEEDAHYLDSMSPKEREEQQKLQESMVTTFASEENGCKHANCGGTSCGSASCRNFKCHTKDLIE